MNRARLLPLVAVLAIGCSAQTDQTVYDEAAGGVATFSNHLEATVFLGGCNEFVQERFIGGEWVHEGGETTCFWEGFARPVPPQRTAQGSFTARQPGTWRLAYDVGVGCSEDAPLEREHCVDVRTVHSNEFEVVGSRRVPCGGLAGLRCPAGSSCFDQPGDACGPLCAADCLGFCAVPEPIACGGIAGVVCPDGLACIDEPRDVCDPDCGGADCSGICVDPLRGG